jgi:hypothetical protein
VTFPQWTQNGYMAGYYYDIEYVVGEDDYIVLQVGLLDGADDGDVTFNVSIEKQDGNTDLVARIHDIYDGELPYGRYPLGDWAGQKATFYLWVQAGDTALLDWATWVIARIERGG